MTLSEASKPIVPEQIFTVQVKWEFDSSKDRENFMKILENLVPFLSRAYSSYWTHCKLCLRPRWRTNIDAEGYCVPAYYRSCDSHAKDLEKRNASR